MRRLRRTVLWHAVLRCVHALLPLAAVLRQRRRHARAPSMPGSLPSCAVVDLPSFSFSPIPSCRWGDDYPDTWEPEEHVSPDLIALWERQQVGGCCWGWWVRVLPQVLLWYSALPWYSTLHGLAAACRSDWVPRNHGWSRRTLIRVHSINPQAGPV